MIPRTKHIEKTPAFKCKISARRIIISSLVFAVLFTAGCSKLNCTRFEELLGNETDLIRFSFHIADNLVGNAHPPLIPQHPEMAIVVTTFVDNNDLDKTSHFGRVLQEHISSRLVQNGYTVRELKAAPSLTIEPQKGETILTRDLNYLQDSHQIQAIMVGTISRSERIIYISARLIDPATKNIISTDDYRLCMDDNILSMFGLRRQSDTDTTIKEPRHPLF